MNRDMCKMIAKKLEAHLATLQLPNMVVKVGGARFGDTNVTFKLEISELKDGMVMSKEANDFLSMAEFTGFKKEDLGKLVGIRGVEYKLVGAKWGGKMPILLQRPDGSIYRFQTRAVLAALGHPIPASEVL